MARKNRPTIATLTQELRAAKTILVAAIEVLEDAQRFADKAQSEEVKADAAVRRYRDEVEGRERALLDFCTRQDW